MLEALNLGCVRGDRRLFRGLNFSVRPGEAVEVHGPNGSGKTSLLRIICGLATPADGEVRWNGTNIRRLGEEYLASIAYVAHQNGVKDELSAIENLLVSGRIAGYAPNNGELCLILEQLGLVDQRNLPTHLLSAGQRRRLALARLWASKATLWILDELWASLDDSGVRLARDLIAAHLSKGGLAIIATHQELNLNAGARQRIELAT
jgi:heme exporter protein A